MFTIPSHICKVGHKLEASLATKKIVITKDIFMHVIFLPPDKEFLNKEIIHFYASLINVILNHTTLI